MFEANCSKQMGQCKTTIFHKNVLVFTRGVTKVRVSDVDRNCLSGIYEAEGDWTDTEGLFLRWN